jgi:hypothetical protein
MFQVNKNTNKIKKDQNQATKFKLVSWLVLMTMQPEDVAVRVANPEKDP